MNAGRRIAGCALLAAIMLTPIEGTAAVIPIGPGRPGFDPNRVAVPPAPPPGGGVVYDNTTSLLDLYLGGFQYGRTGDQVDLALAPGLFASLTVWYYGAGFDGDETLTVSIHAMDGPPTPGSFGFNPPGTQLYTATVPIAEGVADVTFVDPAPSIVMPATVAVVVAFAGVDFDPSSISGAGPLLADPPTVGSSLDDYWIEGFPNPGDPWALFTFGGNPAINLALRLTTVRPVAEPGITVLLALALGLLASWRRRAAA
jgi:hypothetical protein